MQPNLYKILKPSRKHVIECLCILGVFAPLPNVYAEEENYLMLGSGLIVEPTYSGSRSFRLDVTPILNASYQLSTHQSLFWEGESGGYDYQLTSGVSVGIVGEYQSDRSTSSDYDLNGLQDLSSTFAIGPRIAFQTSEANEIDVRYLTDINNAKNGSILRLADTLSIPLNERMLIELEGDLNYGNRRYLNAFYGVTPVQAQPGRATYQPGSGLASAGIGATTTYSFTKHWNMITQLSADYLLDKAANSPLSEQDFQPSLMVGFAYRF